MRPSTPLHFPIQKRPIRWQKRASVRTPRLDDGSEKCWLVVVVDKKSSIPSRRQKKTTGRGSITGLKREGTGEVEKILSLSMTRYVEYCDKRITTHLAHLSSIDSHQGNYVSSNCVVALHDHATQTIPTSSLRKPSLRWPMAWAAGQSPAQTLRFLQSP